MGVYKNMYFVNKAKLIDELIIGQNYLIKYPAFKSIQCTSDVREGRLIDLYKSYMVFEIKSIAGNYRYSIEYADVLSGECKMRELDDDK